MAGDLVIEEGGLGVLRDHTRDVASRLQSVSVTIVDDYIFSGVGGNEFARLGRSAGETIDDAIVAVSRNLDDFSQFVNGSINAYNATENGTAVTFRWTARGGPAMTMDDLRRKVEE